MSYMMFMSAALLILTTLMSGLQCQDIECHPHCKCNNGNSVTCFNVAEIPRPLPKSTMHLFLTNNFIGKILLKHEVDPLGNLSLRQLYLKHNRIAAIQNKAFSFLVYLETLDLSGNRIEAITDETFFGLKKLMYLYLNDAGIFTISKQPFLSNPSLVEIDLEDNELMIIERQFTRLRNMSELLLANNKIADIAREAFSDLTHLKQLSLFGNKLRKPSSSWFRGVLSNNGSLELDSRFTSLQKKPNPWLCCPDVALFDNFVKATDKKLQSYYQLDIVCSWPITLSGRLMSTLTSSELNSVPCSEYSTTTPAPTSTEGANSKSNKNLVVIKTSAGNFLSHMSDAGLFFILVLFVLIGVIAVGLVYLYKTRRGREKIHDFVVSFSKNKTEKLTVANSSTKTFQQENSCYGATSPNTVKSPTRPPRPSRPAPSAPKPHPRIQNQYATNPEPHSTYTIDTDYTDEDVWDKS